jgi:hypothetical protein
MLTLLLATAMFVAPPPTLTQDAATLTGLLKTYQAAGARDLQQRLACAVKNPAPTCGIIIDRIPSETLAQINVITRRDLHLYLSMGDTCKTSLATPFAEESKMAGRADLKPAYRLARVRWGCVEKEISSAIAAITQKAQTSP